MMLAINIFEALLTAKYTRDKRAILLKANLELEKFRFMIRLCYEEKIMTVKQYQRECDNINAIGKIAGGWLQSLS